ncbi:hypothetical protein GCM10023189_48180 [Nibrella saemangeumensis]|uniref:Uncharacterized protein n=1 Tax=Nibrella saemangeumensis TaxID=1084526 RepID=A0ABP8NFY9_9BACT
MKKLVFAISLFGCLFGRVAAQPDAVPQVDIVNDVIRAKLYLPDEQQGYYRGVRFDWSGLIASLEYKGHTYFGKWFGPYDPKMHDAVTGPVEEFGPIGYEAARPGENFLKIGVGVLRRLDDKAYHFTTPYELVNPGKWTVTTGPDRAEFMHYLTDQEGHSYIYRKSLRLVKGKPELVLAHSLENTGSRLIETNVYNHNFFMLDKQPTGPDFVVRFPFTLKATGEKAGLLETRGNELVYLRPQQRGDQIYVILEGYGTSTNDYDIRVENTKTKAGVRVTADRPLSKLAFWSNPANLSPEPYIGVRVEPGKTVTWTLTYQFYTLP